MVSGSHMQMVNSKQFELQHADELSLCSLYDKWQVWQSYDTFLIVLHAMAHHPVIQKGVQEL